MKNLDSEKRKHNLFSGGLAELIPSPSGLTYSYLKHWFTGNSSLGKAMKLLGLPYEKSDLSIFKLIDGQLFINLENEEKTLYQNTIFHYRMQKDARKTPKLTVDIGKIINPVCWFNTLRTLFIQSLWILTPMKMVKRAKSFADAIPDRVDTLDIRQIDQILKEKVWPYVIAIGYLSEFYFQFLKREFPKDIVTINNYINTQAGEKDWFFRSLFDQKRVKENQLTFAEYLQIYGLRADQDYELTCPRWYEIPETIIKRIKDNTNIKNYKNKTGRLEEKIKFHPAVKASISLQILRSEAKRKALFFIDQLRKMHHLSGTSVFIRNNKTKIPPSSICIFPHAGAEFTHLYSRCKSIVFLRGGDTSHGMIVAHELGIPAIIASF